MAFIIPGFPNELPVNAIGIPYESADIITPAESNGGVQWGIYQNGEPYLAASPGITVSSFSYRQDYTVSDYPIEGGSFASYDKVVLPFDVRLRFVVSGDTAFIRTFLDNLDSASDPSQSGLNTYSVYMPENQYDDCNITHYDFTRTTRDGLGILICDVWLIQIRIVSESSGEQENTQQPSGADPVNGGSVQTTSPTSVQSATPFA